MMNSILAKISDLDEALRGAALSHRCASHARAVLATLAGDIATDLGDVPSPRLSPADEERARQAAAQGDADGGYLPMKQAPDQ